MQRIIDSFKYIFSQKGWEKKVGYLFIAMLIVYFVSGVFSFILQVPLEIMITMMRDHGNDVSAMNALSSSISSMSSILSLPLTFYITGYIIDVVKNIVKSEKDVLPEHNDLMKTFVNGAKLYVSTFIATLPTTILGSLVFFTTLIVTITAFVHTGERGLYVGFGIILFILTILIGVLIAVVNSVVSYASWYIYLKTNSFRAAINYKTIISVIRDNEKALLALLLDLVILGFAQMLLGIVAVILICICFLTIPAAVLLGYFARAYIVGHAFKNMSKLEVK